MIGPENDDEYYDQVFVIFIEEQLIYLPNSRSIIDLWITITANLFIEGIKNYIIPITEMPAVLQKRLMKSIDENCTKYIDKLKKEVIISASKELRNASERRCIPSIY